MALSPLLQNERGKAAEMEKKSIFSFLDFRLLVFWNSGSRNGGTDIVPWAPYLLVIICTPGTQQTGLLDTGK